MPLDRRTRRSAFTVSAAVGAVTGLACTYPWELGPAVCLPAWALVGLLLGLLLGRPGTVLSSGIGYGVFLTLAFLYSRFGGAAHNLPAYTAFVLAMSVVGGLAGVAVVFVGSWLRGQVARDV